MTAEGALAHAQDFAGRGRAARRETSQGRATVSTVAAITIAVRLLARSPVLRCGTRARTVGTGVTRRKALARGIAAPGTVARRASRGMAARAQWVARTTTAAPPRRLGPLQQRLLWPRCKTRDPIAGIAVVTKRALVRASAAVVTAARKA